MAQCRYCKRSGLFLSVTTNGLCTACEPVVMTDVQQRARVIGDCIELVKKSTKLDTRLSRCDLLLEQAQSLTRYEVLGIPTLSPSPSQLVHRYRAERERLIVEGLQAELDAAHSRATLAVSPKTKVNHLSKALLRIREFKAKTVDPTALNHMDECTASEIQQIQLNGYLEEARKAEFKGQRKKALDQYLEALYFLKNDEIEDSLQMENISTIEAKIAELGGKA
jgi:hypothetical protein